MINPIQKLLNTKFRNKLVFMCITAVVPVTLAGVFLLYNLADTIKVNAENESISTADSLRTRLNDIILTISNVSERVLQSSKIKELLNNEFINQDEYFNYYMQNQVIPEFLDAYPQIENITFYIDLDGFVANSNFKNADESVCNTYWYKEAMESDLAKWQIIYSNDEYRLCRISPLKNNKGNFCGAMVSSVSPKVYSELTENIDYSVAFSVSKGVVFYSNIPGIDTGSVLASEKNNFYYGISGSKLLEDDSSRLNKIGHTVISYFDYGNTGNFFQIYVLKPYSLFNDEINNVIFMYIWYIFLCIVLSVLITLLFSSMFSRRIQFLKNQMHKVTSGNFVLNEEIRGTDEIFELYHDLKKMVDSMQTLMNDAYKSKIQSESFKLNQVEAEFKALASQINPHFLYNTLETIRMKAYCNDDKETADLVKKLGKFMRRCLEVKDGMVTLESELEFTKSYLELQAARFGDRVSYSIYCEVDRNYKILPLIIQPIVENAFVHGIEGEKANGKIDIKVFYRSGQVIIEVSDNGQGIPADKLRELLAKLEKNDTSSGKSIGLTNVNKRIKMYHGEQYGLTVETTFGHGTAIRITLPQKADENIMKRLPEKYSEISENISSKRI
ncbi:MAG: sensor histidine kinase [Oscillospiraceae bacterium]|nr:sensor histidine kinase [Oscillospiraceae bacterium]